MNGTRGLLIATAAAFIVGCSVGLMGGILFMRFAVPGPAAFMRDGRGPGRPPYFERRAGRDPRRPRGPGRDEQMLSRLERELDLSPSQRERIVAQLDRARRQHAAVRESTEAWIERELTPAQREQWKQMEARFEQLRLRGGPGRPPPPDRR